MQLLHGLCFHSCLQIPALIPSVTEWDQRVASWNKLAPLQVAFGHGDHHSTRLLIKMDPSHQVQQLLFLVLCVLRAEWSPRDLGFLFV